MSKNFLPAVPLLFFILLISISLYKSQDLYKKYRAEVSRGLDAVDVSKGAALTEEDIRRLPEPVQNYLHYTGVVGKERAKNMRVITDGEFKPDPQRDWARVETQQYNFFDNPARFYYLKLKMFGLPVMGLHSYSNAEAGMLVKLAGLVPVARGGGPEMARGETVTVFNDMCLFAPATLIDGRIQWESVDPLTARATFNNNGIKVSAVLHFNEKGELINFVSEDRFYSPTGKTFEKYKWSTPVRDYRDFNGVKLAAYGEAVWHFPDGEYSYAKLHIRDVKYNVTSRT